MKKLILWIAVCPLLVFSNCSDDKNNEPPVNDKEISFVGRVKEYPSDSGIPAEDYQWMQGQYVKIQSGEEIRTYKADATGKFTSDTPYENGVEHSIKAWSPSLFQMRQDQTTELAHKGCDYIYALPIHLGTSDQNAILYFQHKMTKVVISVQADSKDFPDLSKAEVAVSGYTVARVMDDGTVSGTEKGWIKLYRDRSGKYNGFLIPAEIAETDAIKVTVDKTDYSFDFWEIRPALRGLYAGHQYAYNVQLIKK